ncbi:TPA: hypothetical protein EYP44_05090, partial [Candidatus Bathyarchaeota archaeon]|nr:hypothetical protein [Candidatus Bathyarchaeota archaeon]
MSEGTVFMPEEEISELPPSYLLSVHFDGQREVPYAKLYDPTSRRIFLWHDMVSRHHPYCLCDATEERLRRIRRLMSHPGLIGFERVRKFDPLLE